MSDYWAVAGCAGCTSISSALSIAQAKVATLCAEVEGLRREHLEALRNLDAEQEEMQRVTAKLAEVEKERAYLHSSVGECHLMISRNTSAFQTGREWTVLELPDRLGRIMQARAAAEPKLSALAGLVGEWREPAIESLERFYLRRCADQLAAILALSPEAHPIDVGRSVIHHMTLMLSDFGAHDKDCVCSVDQTMHAVDCRDCECGLREALEFGIEHSFPLEPPPLTPEQEVRLHQIEQRAVTKALADAGVDKPTLSPEGKP